MPLATSRLNTRANVRAQLLRVPLSFLQSANFANGFGALAEPSTDIPVFVPRDLFESESLPSTEPVSKTIEDHGQHV
jgi:hypothetical protein